MKSLSFVSAIVGVVLATEPDAHQLENPIPRKFQEVYGEASSQPTPLIPKPMRGGSKYFSVRSKDNCIFPLEVVIVQDSTESFHDDYEQMRDMQLKLMVEGLTKTHPDSSFGLVSFRDKPIRTLGEPFDYCHRYDLPLTSNDTFNKLYDAYGKLWSNGGQDPAENQFGAIIAALESNQVGWSKGEESVATKLLVVSTDAWPHFDQDGLNNYGMTPNTGHLDQSDEEGQCSKQYYPSPAQVRDVITTSGAYAAFLVFDGHYGNNLVVDSWKWFNNYMGQPETFLEPLANDASNFWDILSNIIKAIEDEECIDTTPQPEPTVTPVAPTEPATTVAPTTTPAPTEAPTTTPAPTEAPTTTPAPTEAPTTTPAPTEAPTTTPAPTEAPTTTPAPTEAPTTTPAPTEAPTTTPAPTEAPTTTPAPTEAPTTTPAPTEAPTTTPAPTEAPTTPPAPTPAPTDCPTHGGDCPCEACPCPEVLIKLLHKPAELHLDVSNE